jgi:hypothetical protein
VCDKSADLDHLMSPERVAVETERLLGFRCHSVVPIACGQNPNSRLARVDLSPGAPYPAVVYKVFDDASGYLRETRNLRFISQLGDFAPRLLAQDDVNQALVMEFMQGAQFYELPKERIPAVAEAAMSMFAELHCLAVSHISDLIAAYDGKPPRWEPPDCAVLATAWSRSVSGAASKRRVSVPIRELGLLVQLLRSTKDSWLTLALFDINPFNLIWCGDRVRLVDIGACIVGPAWLDVGFVRRGIGMTESEILAGYRLYLERRHRVGNPVTKEKQFLKAADYWEVASALQAAEDFQAKSEGAGQFKPGFPQDLLQHARFRDDVLADVWAISHRRPELADIARAMEQLLPADICQERASRG